MVHKCGFVISLLRSGDKQRSFMKPAPPLGSGHHTNTQVEGLSAAAPTCDRGADTTAGPGPASHGGSWSGCCEECEACVHPVLRKEESGRTVVIGGAE